MTYLADNELLTICHVSFSPIVILATIFQPVRPKYITEVRKDLLVFVNFTRLVDCCKYLFFIQISVKYSFVKTASAACPLGWWVENY